MESNYTYSEPINCINKMNVSVKSLPQTGINKNKEYRTESGISSFSGENRFPPEPIICRTMTVGQPGKVKKIYQPENQNQIFYSVASTVSKGKNSSGQTLVSTENLLFSKNHIGCRKQLKISNSFTKSSNNLSTIKSIQIPSKMTFELARLLRESFSRKLSGSGINCHNHVFTSSHSFHSSKSQCRPSSGHHWTFGMSFLLMAIISILSIPSVVLCVPLTSHQSGESASNTGLLSTDSSPNNRINSRIWQLQQRDHQLDEPAPASYNIMHKGQIYLPSLINSSPLKAGGIALASSPSDYSADWSLTKKRNAAETAYIGENQQQQSNQYGTSNYHLQQLHHPQNREENLLKHAATPIQKIISQQQQRNLPRKMKEGKGETDFDDDITPAELHESNSQLEYFDDPSSSSLGQSEWETVYDPHLYVLTEWGTPQLHDQFPSLHQQRKRRNSGSGPSLSIVNPLDVLRQRLLLEIARRRMRQSHNQIIANEEILRKIGRRRR